MAPSKALIYKKLPATWLPVAGQDLVIETQEVDIETAPKDGLVLEVLYLSFDPYVRGRMRDPSAGSYTGAFEIGKPITNDAVSRVIKSDHPDFQEGDLVNADTPFVEYFRVEDPEAHRVRKVNNPYNLDPSYFVGPLGMPGLTAWSSLYKIGQPKKGETIFVSSAAGAVGQIVGQIAKHEGLKVIGSVGSEDKLDFIVNQLGFDGGFNYKTEKAADALKRLAPDGIDIYYDNVGGDQLETALDAINPEGRIVACGMISEYSVPLDQRKGIRNLMNVITKKLIIQGFIVSQPAFGPAYAQEHQEKLQKWLADGSVKATIHVTNGIDNAVEGFNGLLQGKNFGKAVLKVKQ